MLTNNERIIFLSRLSAQQLAQEAKNNPTDPLIDSVLTKRIRNLGYCLKDWFYPLPLQQRQDIIYCLQNGIEHPSADFYAQLQQVTLPAYKEQTPGLQKMFLGVLEKFAILAPLNMNDDKRHFFQFYYKLLEHNALTDRLDEQRSSNIPIANQRNATNTFTHETKTPQPQISTYSNARYF